jgi:hypothetical protein
VGGAGSVSENCFSALAAQQRIYLHADTNGATLRVFMHSKFSLLFSMVCLAILSLTSRGFAQDWDKLHSPWVSCFDVTGEHFLGPKTRRTPVLTSHNRVNKAYAEIRAQPVGNDCKNTAELFVSVKGPRFVSVFTQLPSNENGTASSLGPVEWSLDDRWLAVEQSLASYSSDAAGVGLLLYDSRSNTVKTFSISREIEAAMGRHCTLVSRILGFDARNRVRIRVADSIDGTGDRESSCFSAPEDWSIDPATLSAERVGVVK